MTANHAAPPAPNHLPKMNNRFLLGNLILGTALILLLFMGKAWDLLGAAAMVLWVALAGAGMHLLMKDKE